MPMTRTLASRRALAGMVRGLGVAVCAAIALISGTWDTSWPQVLAVAILATAASIPQAPPWFRDATVMAEAAAIAAILVANPEGGRPAIAYLVIPPIVASLSLGTIGVVSAVASSALVLVTGTVVRDSESLPGGVVELTLWLAVAITLGLGAVLTQHLRQRRVPADEDYEAARRLLTSLRDVARSLPGGLEETVLARSALDRLAELLPHDRSAVYLRGPGRSLLQVADDPPGSTSWVPSTDRGTWGQAWESGTAVQRLGSLAGAELGTVTACAVIPLRLSGKAIGLVALERAGGLWPIDSLAVAQRSADDAALRLDTARLFEEVRDLATVEERRRLSREIHDGIAQEIAGLGFLVDDALSRSPDEEARADLARIRSELTRMVTELRLSIYDLRADVGAGIGEALGAFARSVGSDAGLTVHLVLDEDASRLPAGVAPEILRIAQEAVANARRHARARTLWVSYRVADGSAFLRVADDGLGISSTSPREDSYGLQIMRERADRIGGTLTVRERGQGGTVVELTVPTANGAGTMAPGDPVGSDVAEG